MSDYWDEHRSVRKYTVEFKDEEGDVVIIGNDIADDALSRIIHETVDGATDFGCYITEVTLKLEGKVG